MMRPQIGHSVSFLNLRPIEDYVGDVYVPLLDALRELARAHNVQVCLVGGPVRDLLLGFPINDLDFAIVGDAPSLARAVANKLGAHIRVHPRFGTANVSLGGAHIDLVTARRETYPTPGSLPMVEPSSLEEDLARRDFSINAMAIAEEGQESRLLDPSGGRGDLEQRLIRVLHRESFSDDPTRLFRALKYEQRLGFALETKTEFEFERAVESRRLETASGDRIRHELERIFAEKLPGRVLERAIQTGLLASILPGLNRTDFISRWEFAQAQDDKVSDPGMLSWLAALAYPLSGGEGETLIARLNMPAAWTRVVRDILTVRDSEAWLSEAALPASLLYRRLYGLATESLQAAAGVTESPVVATNIRTYLTNLQHTSTVLSGTDLLALGVPAGTQVGKALAKLRDARLDGQVVSEMDERKWVLDFVAAKRRTAAPC